MAQSKAAPVPEGREPQGPGGPPPGSRPSWNTVELLHSAEGRQDVHHRAGILGKSRKRERQDRRHWSGKHPPGVRRSICRVLPRPPAAARPRALKALPRLLRNRIIEIARSRWSLRSTTSSILKPSSRRASTPRGQPGIGIGQIGHVTQDSTPPQPIQPFPDPSERPWRAVVVPLLDFREDEAGMVSQEPVQEFAPRPPRAPLPADNRTRVQIAFPRVLVDCGATELSSDSPHGLAGFVPPPPRTMVTCFSFTPQSGLFASERGMSPWRRPGQQGS